MKKKTLAKKQMPMPNNLITELMFREGMKSQIKIGDMWELISKLGDILISPDRKDEKLRNEFAGYLEQKHALKYSVGSHVNIGPLYAYNYEIDAVKKAHRKLRKKAKAGRKV